jgi:2-oxoglutarate dehydrogenase E1 component
MTATDHTSQPHDVPNDFGTNSWLVDEMYGQFVADPESVSESWREFFSDYRGAAPATFGGPAASAARSTAPAAAAEPVAPPAPVAPADEALAPVAPAPAAPTVAAPTPAPAPATPANGTIVVGDDVGEPIRGAGVAIAANMERSLSVPTATSFRNVPAKLLEVNRKVINGYRSRSGQGKVSFTHLIGYAIVRAIADAVPGMNNTYAEGADGKPRLVRNTAVNMGLAVDVSKADG